MSRWALVAMIAAVACDEPMGALDAGAPDAGATGIAEAAAPSFSACSDGRAQATSAEGLSHCSAPAVTDCGDGAWLIGGCVELGSACPGGDGFAADLPASGVLYVRAGASGGTGARAAPYGTIAQAMSAAASGTIIALAPGIYDEQVVMRSGVTVRGACARETILDWSAVRGGGTVQAVSGVSGAAIHDLTIAPSDNIGVLVRGGSALTMSGVRVHDAMLMGIAVLEGSTLSASEVLVRGTRRTDDLGLGRGVVIEGSTATFEDLILERNVEFGLITTGATSRVEIDGLSAIDHLVGGTPALGAGVGVGSGATLIVRRALIERSIGAAALALVGGVLEIEDAEIRSVDAPAPGQAGWALGALDGTLTARRVVVRDAQGVAVGAYGTSELSLEDVLVQSTRTTEGVAFGAGLVVSEQARASALRTWIEGSSATHVLVSGVEGVTSGGPTLIATDLTLIGLTPLTIGAAALFAQSGSSVELTRLRIERASDLAIGVNSGSALTLTDAIVRDTAANASIGALGRGLEVVGGRATLTRALFERQHEIAVIVSNGELVAQGLTILDTRARPCEQTSCADQPAGIAVGSYGGGAVTLRDFTIDGARLCGVQVDGDGALDLRAGTIANALVGACVQIDGYDVARLTDGVEYRGNDVAVQATSYVPPEPRDVLIDL